MSYFLEYLRFLTTQTSLVLRAAEGAQGATFCPLLSALFLLWSWAVPCPAMPSHARAAGAAPAAGLLGWQVPAAGRRALVIWGAAGARKSRELPLSLRTHPAVSPGEMRFHSPLGLSAGCGREMIPIHPTVHPVVHPSPCPCTHSSLPAHLSPQQRDRRTPGSRIPSSRSFPR